MRTEEASPIHVLNASQSLVVSRDGLSTSIRLAGGFFGRSGAR